MVEIFHTPFLPLLFICYHKDHHQNNDPQILLDRVDYFNSVPAPTSTPKRRNLFSLGISLSCLQLLLVKLEKTTSLHFSLILNSLLFQNLAKKKSISVEN